MLEIVRQDRDSLIRAFGISRRLASRVGALLARQVACTATVLEEAARDAALAELLTHPSLTDTSIPTPDAFAHLRADAAYAPVFARLGLALVPQPEDWTAIALEEELRAEEGFGRVAADSASSLPAIASAPMVPGLNVQAQVEDSALDRLRVNVFAAATSAERVSALRMLDLGNAPEALRREVFLKALSEPDAAVRAAAARGLRSMGLSPDVTELLSRLAEGSEREQRDACGQLSRIGASMPEAERLAIIMGACGVLRGGGGDVTLRIAAVEVLGRIAPGHPLFPALQDDLSRFVVGQMVGFGDIGLAAVRGTLVQFLCAAPDAVQVTLTRLSQGGDVSTRAFLAATMGAPAVPESVRAGVRGMALACLLELPADRSLGHVLGAVVMSGGEGDILSVVDALGGADVAHQRFLVRLLDNHLRARTVSPTLATRLAEAILALLRTGSWNLRADIFETRLIRGATLSPQMRMDTARELLRHLSNYRLPLVQDNVRMALVSMGPTVLPVLRATVPEWGDSPEGEVACRALGQIAAGLSPADTGLQAELEECLRMLSKLAYSATAVPPSIWETMGMLSAAGLFDAKLLAHVRFMVTGRMTGTTADAPFIRALGWLSMAPCGTEADLRQAGELVRKLLSKNPDVGAGTVRTNADGQDMIVMDEATEYFAEIIPAALDAAQHLALAPAIPDDLYSALVELLIDRWRQCVTYRIQWSPANVAALTEVIGHLGACSRTPAQTRARMIRSLGGRLPEAPVLRALCTIFEAKDVGSAFDRGAAAVVTAVLKSLSGQTDMTMDDREERLHGLVRIMRRGRLHDDTAENERLMQRVLDAVSRGATDNVPGALDWLRDLSGLDALPKSIRDRAHALLSRSATLPRLF